MALQGNLRDMSVADLIQQYGQDSKTARLTIQHNGDEATLYFHGGTVAHAVLRDLNGEEAVYRTLQWQDGAFNLEMNIEPPNVTIQRSWSGLLLEGARRLDEETIEVQEIEVLKEKQPMAAKRKSDLLAETLSAVLADSTDIDGVAIVGLDGLVYSANVPNRDMDEDIVGAAAATILGLSRRGVQQLKRGNFARTLIQGDDGNIIVAGLNEETLFVGLTAKNVNLGMAFAEVRDATARIREIL
jgi:uncharacterized protein